MKSLLSLFFGTSKKTSDLELIRSRAPVSGLTASNPFGFVQKVTGNHVYMECGKGDPIVFCHGLFGSFRNFAFVGQKLSNRFRIIVPCLPMYDAPLSKCSVEELSIYLESFLDDLNIGKTILAGNSMGGGLVLHYTIRNPARVSSLMLFSSSGLSFVPMRGGIMKLKDFNYVKKLLSDIFYRLPEVSEEDFREVYRIMQDKSILLRCVSLTRSTKKFFGPEQLEKLEHSVLILWGENDTVIPPEIAHEFKRYLKNSELHFIPECGHSPTFEKPEECLALIEKFLKKKLTTSEDILISSL